MFVTAGFDELERKLQRSAGRLRLLLEQRRLTKAEIDLGALGWQQMEDFPPEIGEQMRAIHGWERQQADFSNQSADMRWNIDALQLQRRQLQKNLDNHLGQFEPALQSLAASREKAEKSIPACRESVRRFDEAIAELDRAHESLGLRIRDLMMETQTLQVRQQVVELGDRRAAYDNEKEDLQRSRMKTSADLKSFERQIDEDDAQIHELNRQVRKAKEEFGAQDKELLSQIAAMQKEKVHATKNANTLDRKKSSAYLAIGRCLADSDIPPMNQPEALEKVFAHRRNIVAMQERIADSLARSSQIPAATLVAFYVAMLLFLVVVAIGAALLLRHHPHP